MMLLFSLSIFQTLNTTTLDDVFDIVIKFSIVIRIIILI